MQPSLTYIIKADQPQEVVSAIRDFVRERQNAARRPKHDKKRDQVLQMREIATLQSILEALDATVVQPKPSEGKPKALAA